MKKKLKHISIMWAGIIFIMGIIRFTAYSQQPFFDVFTPWSFIILVDLFPIEGFNVIDGEWIKTDWREFLSVVVNGVIITLSFFAASSIQKASVRKKVQIGVFLFFALWYLYLAIVSMMVG